MKTKYAVGAAAAIAITIFLYVKTRPGDVARQDEIRQQLIQLREASARFSEDVLKLRASLLTNYDSVASSNALAASAVENLRNFHAKPSSSEERETTERINACAKALAEKEALCEQFKSRFAVLENSLDYLPLLGYMLSSSDLGGSERVRVVNDLLRDTLVYNRGVRSDVASLIRKSIARLQELRPGMREDELRDVEFMIAHVETVLREKPAVDSILGRLVALPVGRRIEELRSSVYRDYDAGVRTSTQYRRALVVFSGMLLLVIAGTFVKLEQKAGALKRVNVDLKQSVQEVARREAETRAVLEGAADGIMSLDEQGMIISYNPAAERMFGHPARTAVGRPIDAFISTPWDVARSRLGVKQETQGRPQEGTAFAVELSLSRIDVGDRKVFIAVMQDITERKKMERLKNEFISTVSHELRTPLTSIRGSLGLLAGGVAGALPAKAGSMITIAYKNSERLVRLVNDILDIEKLEAGKMEFTCTTIDLLALVEQTVEANRAYAQSFGVDISLENQVSQGRVFGDSDRLTQVLTNLISNACKFSPRGQKVEVRLTRDGGRIRVSVADRGPGISAEFRGRIFQKFAQADGSDGRQRQGSGLGLSICKAIVEKMGGGIGFESTPGKGSSFHFEFPELPQPPRQDSAPKNNRPWILICEDEPDIATILVATLDNAGYNSEVVSSARQAKELLQKKRYDGMTLDLALPDQDGISLVRELRQSPLTRPLPIVIVSAYMEEGRRSLNGEAFGIVDWLEKPIDQAKLHAALGQVARPRLDRNSRVLHVEDDADIRELVRMALEGTAEVMQCSTLEDARKMIRTEEFDLLILDIGLPDGSGLELLPALRGTSKRGTPILIFSAQEVSSKTAEHVAATLTKSKTSNEELVHTIKGLLGGGVSAGCREPAAVA